MSSSRDPVVEPFVLPDASKLQAENVARKGNTSFQFVLRKRRNKVPKHRERNAREQDLPTINCSALCQPRRTEMRYWEIIADKLTASGLSWGCS
jgi:hypothetical protein